MKRSLLLVFACGSIVFGQDGAAVPSIPFDSVPNFFKLPKDMNFGEGAGVAVNSKKHVFVFTRGNTSR